MNNEEDKQKVELDCAKEQIARVCQRLALLHLSFAKTITDKLGKEEGRKLILEAIKDYGNRIGVEAKELTERQGLANSPENYKSDLPFFGMHEKVEEVKVDGEDRKRSYGCVMGELWKKLGENELGRLYCYVDPTKYMAYNPEYVLVHRKSIPDGDQFCEFIVRKTTKKEQKDFQSQEQDWSYIDE